MKKSEIRDEIGKDFETSDITVTDIEKEILGPINIEEYRKQVWKRLKNIKFMNILAVYNSSILQDFESFLRTEVDLFEDDIRLVLDE